MIKVPDTLPSIILSSEIPLQAPAAITGSSRFTQAKTMVGSPSNRTVAVRFNSNSHFRRRNPATNQEILNMSPPDMEYWADVKQELTRMETHIDHSNKNTRYPQSSDIVHVQRRYGPFYTMRYIYLNYYYQYHTESAYDAPVQRVWLADMYLWARETYDLRVHLIGPTLIEQNSGIVQLHVTDAPWSGGVYDMCNPTLMTPRQAYAAIDTPDTMALSRRLFYHDPLQEPILSDYCTADPRSEDKHRFLHHVWSVFLNYDSAYDKGATSEELAPSFSPT